MIAIGIHIQFSNIELSMLYTLFLSALAIVLWKYFSIVKLVLEFYFIKFLACGACLKDAKSVTVKNFVACTCAQILLYWKGSDLSFWTIVILYVLLDLIPTVAFVFYCCKSASQQQKAIQSKFSTNPDDANRQRYLQVPVILPNPQLSFSERRMMDIKRYLNHINLMSPYLERDAQGWLTPKATLNTHLDIAKLIGFTIDWSKDCPRVNIYYEPSENGNGLLSTTDLQTLLQIDPEEIKSISFSLDDVMEASQILHDSVMLRRLVTIYQKRCAPRKLANSAIIDTLFHADYLLKFFAIGSEVSAKFPFPVRSICHLISSLPKELQHILRPCHERGESKYPCEHRFWIQILRLIFQFHATEEKEFNFIESVETKVNTESLNEHPTDMRHKEFAEDFTSHYSEISQYFPIFARVVELAKIQYVVRTIHNRLAAKGYEVTAQVSTDQSEGNDINAQYDFAPSSVIEISPEVIYGGVEMFPSYTKYSGTPPVDDISAYSHENGVTNIAKYAREAGIRIETEGKVNTAADYSTLRLKFEQVGISFLELATIATISKQMSA